MLQYLRGTVKQEKQQENNILEVLNKKGLVWISDTKALQDFTDKALGRY